MPNNSSGPSGASNPAALSIASHRLTVKGAITLPMRADIEPSPIAVWRKLLGKISVDHTYTAEKAAPENARPAMFLSGRFHPQYFLTRTGVT
eukprot:COSAG01_NODE_21944_length_878_cov_1.249037_2_plen_92_part_00